MSTGVHRWIRANSQLLLELADQTGNRFLRTALRRLLRPNLTLQLLLGDWKEAIMTLRHYELVAADCPRFSPGWSFTTDISEDVDYPECLAALECEGRGGGGCDHDEPCGCYGEGYDAGRDKAFSRWRCGSQKTMIPAAAAPAAGLPRKSCSRCWSIHAGLSLMSCWNSGGSSMWGLG